MNKSLKTLLIDTASPYLIIGLYEGDQTLASVYQKGNNDHSVTLMDNIETMFSTHKLSVTDIEKIIVGVGPGSYTGVRIGVSVAKLFAWSHDIPLYTVSSLAVKASGENQEGNILSIIEARRNHGFVGVYKLENGVLLKASDDTYRDLSDVTQAYAHAVVAEYAPPQIKPLIDGDVLVHAPNVHNVQPRYLRKTEAQRNKELKQ